MADNPYSQFGGTPALQLDAGSPYSQFGGTPATHTANPDVVMIGGKPVNLRTGEGAEDSSVAQAQQVQAPMDSVGYHDPKAAVAKEFGNRIQQGQERAQQGHITAAGIGTGALGGALQTAHTVGRVANAVTGDNVSALPTTIATPQSLQPTNTSEKIGMTAEEIMEFLGGDEALKGLGLADKFTKLGKVAKLLEEHPLLAKAASIGGNAIRQGTVGGVQALAHGATGEEAATSGAITGVTGGVLETAGAAAGALKNYIWPKNVLRFIGQDGAIQEIAAADVAKIPPGSKLISPGTAGTAADTTTAAQPAQQAGQKIQRELKTFRDLKGAELGRIKSVVEDSIPVTSNGEKMAMTINPESKSSVAAKAILSDLDNAKIDIKDPNMDNIRELAEQFSSGKDIDGNNLVLNLNQIDATKRALNSQIGSLKKQVAQGANGTALGYLKQFKSALDDDIFNFYSKVGDTDAAESLRKLNAEYAQIVQDQTKGAAKNFLKTQKPEQIVNGIISGGPNAQTAVETLLKDLTPESQKMLQDSVTKQLYNRYNLPNGEIDMQAVQTQLNKMGQTAKSLYGKAYTDLKAFVDTAAELQSKKTVPGAAAGKTAQRAIRAASATVGGHAAGVPGIIAGESVGDAIADMTIGKAGQVKIGIGPNESIVLAPEQVREPKLVKLLTLFGRAAKAGNLKSATAAYTAIQNRIHQEEEPTHYYDETDKKIKPIQ